MNKLIHHFTKKPRNLFLLDSLGAMITTFFLFVIMGKFNTYFGMPQTVVNYLAAIALCFCVYSAACFLFVKRNWTLFFRIIACANLLYCALTTVLLINYSSFLTPIGVSYFSAEIAIICLLSCIELKVAARSKEKLKI
jgi:ABC-type long-subunit fatty acid transport system fused permease/ATPase subunit